MTDHDRRVALLLIWVAIAVGTAGLAELIYVAVRWALTGRP